MSDEREIPEHFKGYFKAAGAPVKLVKCSSCNEIPAFCHETEDVDLKPGPGLFFKCENRDCKRKATWYVCLTCQQKVDRRVRAVKHYKSEKHLNNFASASVLARPQDPAAPPAQNPEVSTVESPSKRSFEEAFDGNTFHEVRMPISHADELPDEEEQQEVGFITMPMAFDDATVESSTDTRITDDLARFVPHVFL